MPKEPPVDESRRIGDPVAQDDGRSRSRESSASAIDEPEKSPTEPADKAKSRCEQEAGNETSKKRAARNAEECQ